MRDPNAMNNAEWAARGAQLSSKPKKLSNLLAEESRLKDLSGVDPHLPTEKPIAQSVGSPPQSLNQTGAAGAFNFGGSQSVQASNTKSGRYEFGKVLKKSIASSAERDAITKSVLGNVTSSGKLYRKDVIKSLRGSGLAKTQVNKILGHLGI